MCVHPSPPCRAIALAYSDLPNLLASHSDSSVVGVLRTKYLAFGRSNGDQLPGRGRLRDRSRHALQETVGMMPNPPIQRTALRAAVDRHRVDAAALRAPDLFVQELRREVRAVRPRQRVVDLELPEEGRIAQRLEDLAVELAREVQLAPEAVVEPELDAVAAEMASFEDVDQHRGRHRSTCSSGAETRRRLPFCLPIRAPRRPAASPTRRRRARSSRPGATPG
jgi:hypothetical protein